VNDFGLRPEWQQEVTWLALRVGTQECAEAFENLILCLRLSLKLLAMSKKESSSQVTLAARSQQMSRQTPSVEAAVETAERARRLDRSRPISAGEITRISFVSKAFPMMRWIQMTKSLNQWLETQVTSTTVTSLMRTLKMTRENGSRANVVADADPRLRA
jgi:hypothetical protein